ncbi:MAG: hypothetical protein HUJ68_09465 [Clostridia bacterium]|nr:hypothetical protein [Clostridia bacterium]
MGLFNMMDSIDTCNRLLKQIEQELRCLISATQANDITQVTFHTMLLQNLTTDFVNALDKSSGARLTSYNFCGSRKSGIEIAYYLAEIVSDLRSKLRM